MGIETITNLAAHWPVDWIVIGAFAVFIAFDTMRSGARRACILALALPLSFTLFSALPHAFALGPVAAQFTSPLLQAILLLGITACLFLAVGRIGLSYGTESGAPIQALVTGIATAAIVLALWLEIPALAAIWHFGGQVQAVFAEQYRFFWLACSYVALAFVRS